MEEYDDGIEAEVAIVDVNEVYRIKKSISKLLEKSDSTYEDSMVASCLFGMEVAQKIVVDKEHFIYKISDWWDKLEIHMNNLKNERRG